MNNTFNANHRLGDIVTRFPKAADIFKAYQIDFCCGGDRELRMSLEEKGVNEAEILSKLNSSYEEAVAKRETTTDWTKLSSVELIDHVVNTHHAYLQTELPVLSDLTTKILRAHGSNHGELARVHKLFHSLKMELDQHLIKEEEILFPLIKEYEESPSEDLLQRIRKVMAETEDEHVGAGDILKELREITNQYEVPADGCRTYNVAFDRLQELESDLFQHIHLENNILFQRY
jgi:regulator of cell morphogenesis and NO signaling